MSETVRASITDNLSMLLFLYLLPLYVSLFSIHDMTQTETTGYTLHPNHSFLVKRVTDGGEGTTNTVTYCDFLLS